MSNINRQRFLNYAKWDLTINKSFYRNMTIATASIIFMVTIMGFFIRWTGLKSCKAIITTNTGDISPAMENLLLEQLSVDGTATIIAIICALAMIVFAGCINHPLRNKQGRITALTLPATNGEKFLWHVILMIAGGFLLCVVSLLLADLFNAALSLVTFGPVGVKSLTDAIVNNCIDLYKDLDYLRTDEDASVFVNSLIINLIISYPFMLTIFAFGNALKYKFNILFTIIVLQVIQFVFSILFLIGMSSIGTTLPEWIDSIDEETIFNIVLSLINITSVVMVGLMVFMWWKSYKLYCKAQVTSTWNK